MNMVLVQYWFYVFILFVGLCIFVAISIFNFKNRKKDTDIPVLANKIWYKVLKFIFNYGITIFIAIEFLNFALDIPFAIQEKYYVTEGVITHVYNGDIDVGDSTYSTATAGLHEGDRVRVYYMPVSKTAPIVEIIDYW